MDCIWGVPPRKRTISVIFDCGAVFQGQSLNSELLMGVFIRFQQEPVAMMTDIQAVISIKSRSQKVTLISYSFYGGHKEMWTMLP